MTIPWQQATELRWKPHHGYYEAILGDFDGGDGVRLSLERRPSCYRRGVWRLLVEVCGGPNHAKWGCFDEADQPERHYHNVGCALLEADCIAAILKRDRERRE